jgi:hypothetical protein
MVMQLDDQSFVMYYSASSPLGKHCVGISTSGTVVGPYTPRNESFTCHIDQGGAIDPAGHRTPDGSESQMLPRLRMHIF